MLNEIGEFEQYTNTAPFGNRLKYNTLIKGKFSGLERAMTIIARRVIFGLNNESQLDVEKEEDFEAVKNYLKIWCGFPKDNSKDNGSRVPNGWLKEYLQNMLSLYQGKPQSTKKIIECLKETLPAKEKQFKKSIFFISEKNAFRAINYDRVIARALLLGQLKRYYLFCMFTEDELKRLCPEDRKLLKKDVVLKLTAYYLLEKCFTDQSWVIFNKANFENWMSSGKVENLHLENFTVCFDEKVEALFEEKKIPNVNIVKLRVNPKWLVHFRLIKESELNDEMAKPENKGGIFFSDTGGGAEPLKENECYG